MQGNVSQKSLVKRRELQTQMHASMTGRRSRRRQHSYDHCTTTLMARRSDQSNTSVKRRLFHRNGFSSWALLSWLLLISASCGGLLLATWYIHKFDDGFHNRRMSNRVPSQQMTVNNKGNEDHRKALNTGLDSLQSPKLDQELESAAAPDNLIVQPHSKPILSSSTRPHNLRRAANAVPIKVNNRHPHSNNQHKSSIGKKPSITETKPDPQPDPLPPQGMSSSDFLHMVLKRAKEPFLNTTVDIVVRQRFASGNNFDNAALPVVPVLVWPLAVYGFQTAEHKLIEEDGIRESRYLKWVGNISEYPDNLVWVGDVGWGWTWSSWCVEFAKAIKQAMSNRYALGLPTRWPIYIVDFTDGATLLRCQSVENIMGADLVHYSARAMGKGRRWSDELQWVIPGSKLSMKSKSIKSSSLSSVVSYGHTPLVVRTDTVAMLEEVLHSLQPRKELWDNIEELDRTVDVTHFWPLANTTSRRISTGFAKLRNRVSEVVIQLGEDKNLSTFVGIQGKGGPGGRSQVHSEYIEAMLQTKILVISQRDIWEDHYRLMEGLVSGACVLTDFMFGLPSGLENSTSILMYRSAQELESFIVHYLEHDTERIAVARRGREIAMSSHRSWHRMEEVVFGRILSTCNNLTAGGFSRELVLHDKSRQPPCPWTVHVAS
ncbi:hypothetical protein ACA910_015569 [Epithemia clementina (nom. ined.)]